MIKLITFIRPIAIYLLITWVVIILIASVTPNIPTLKFKTTGTSFRLDYIMHFCEYGFLAFLGYLSFVKRSSDLKRILLVTLTIIVFAISEEFHQKLVPGRSFNPIDILSNLAGIMAALIFCIVLFRKEEARRIG